MKIAEKASETKEAKGNGLRNGGKLPFEDYASGIDVGDLARILVHRSLLTIDDYELLVMRGHMIPRLKVMNDSNWREIKTQLLTFLDKKNWRSSEPEEAEGAGVGSKK